MKRTKDEVQAEAEEALRQNNYRGLIAMATGTGKSKVAINVIRKHHLENFELRVLIVVPTEKLRDENWKDEFYKWGHSFIWNNNVERSCYVSINKMEGEFFDIVILDEAHNITANNSKFFEQNFVNHIIALTATPPEKEEKREILKSLEISTIYRVSLDEAVEWGLISPFKITVIQTGLDTIKKVIPAGNKQKRFFQTEFAAYVYLSNQINSIDVSTASSVMMGKRKNLILKRMRLIYDLPSKTEVAKFLLKHYIPEKQRTLIFAGSIPQAEEVCENYFHSKSKSEGLNLFLEEKINRLSSVRALNEGMNISNLDNALIIQLNSNELDIIQRIGRIVRYRDNHVADIIIINVRNTVDEKWLKSALIGFDESNIVYRNFSQLKSEYND